ncbi:FimV/HubP family polar landmark protein [Caenimonas soli]|uniref:FimV/HubP family polar landmark protein n=1 Tax=Caenimonas soli TaxID=2735555 RepID=UPI001553AE87|nr:FimV/HubP family polar landmark protein [Caenimonas soli]NPC56232.1 fimbrial protein FimV [Caenimonas soli]
MEKPHWRATALAIATAVLLGISATDAHALGLGRLTVQSAIGEPLHAEIDIAEINPEELASLRTSIASPEAFRAAGLEYNPALSSVSITIERRANGRPYLRLSSQRPVNDPFVDLILETNWSSGRIVRDYTLLFDPPSLRQSAPPLAAQVPPTAPSQRARPGTPAPATAAPSTRAPVAPAARATPAPAREAVEAKQPSGDGKQVTVQAGDTAGKIAAANKAASVSLDQMLVALLRANPEAFIGGNVNRLKSGAVLDVPTEEQAGLVPSGEAKQSIIAQSRDFNEFRRRLAEGLPATGIAAPDRQVSGKVTAQVEEKKAAAPTPDKLTLSKGAVQGKAAEDKIARERAAQDAATRVAELDKNISDLNKLGVATAPASSGSASAAKSGVALPIGPASAAKPVTAPAITVAASAPVAATVVAPAAIAAASTPALSASTPAAIAPATEPASAPMGEAATSAASPASAAASAATAAPVATAAASAAKAAPAPAAPAETTLVEDLLENPIVPASIGGILALLLGFGFYRAQQRKKSNQVDSSFLESRLQPDSFFGASGGQRIDTNEGGATGSSLVYSPSQLDAAGDVDPVAEADVYLAYGRDLQAEEILKEAMRTTPQRVAIHSKLLEIYSKRRDAKAFELVATEAYGLTRGEGPDWEHICELGQELDAANSLYRAGGQPTSGATGSSAGKAAAATAAAAVGSFGATTPTPVVPAAAPAVTDLDLDLDFSLDDDEPAAPAPTHAATQPIVNLNAAATQPVPSLDMDFGSPTAPVALASQPDPVRLDAPDLTLDPNSLSFTAEPPKAAASAAPAAVAAPVADAGMIEFDLGALSLDLPGNPAPAVRQSDADEAPVSTQGATLISADYEDSSGDPLATKLALAEEFNAIGDPDGARSLAQEVLAEASGDLKNRAQRFLAEIS